MEEKPHILILGINTKRGKHAFNFDKYVVRLNYQFNSEGIILELFPPSKKKQIDYNYFVSPYGEIQNPQKTMVRCTEKRIKRSKDNSIKAKRNDKENVATTEKPGKGGKAAKKKSVLKKCSIQEIFNFSEVPNAINTFFPYEGSQIGVGVTSIAENSRERNSKDIKSKATFNKPIPSSMKLLSNNDPHNFFVQNLRRSNTRILSDPSGNSIRNQNSIATLHRKLDILTRKNQTLEKKLAVHTRPLRDL